MGFKENPLPQVISIYPKLNELTKAQFEILISDLKNFPEIEIVKVDMDWVARSYNLLNLWKYLSFVLTLLLNLGALIIICCVSYVAPHQCVRHSLIGSVLAILLINFILMKLRNLGFVLQGLEISCNIILVLSTISLGVISSKFSLRKH